MYVQTCTYVYAHIRPYIPPCIHTQYHIYLSEAGEPHDKRESVHLVLYYDYWGKVNKHHMQVKQSTWYVPLQLHILLYGDRQA